MLVGSQEDILGESQIRFCEALEAVIGISKQTTPNAFPFLPSDVAWKI